MKIAFYAPMKPPDHPVPSGDRRMAQLLAAALGEAGHHVEIVSRFRSYLPTPAAAAQDRLRSEAAHETDRIAALWEAPGTRPDLWFTYHNYHKAPDLLGPTLSRRFDLPYAITEASRSPRRSAEWTGWYEAAEAAIREADLHFCFTARDRAGIEPVLHRHAHIVDLPPFIDTRGWPPAGLRRRHDPPTLVTVAMMRAGDKLASYRLLAASLACLLDISWRLTIVGDGAARPQVEAAFADLPPSRVTWAGILPPESVLEAYARSDLYAWPGFGEAFGLSYLEAQAMGLPVVALNVAGVSSVVHDGVTGLLVSDPSPAAVATALRRLILDAEERCSLGAVAAAWVREARTLAGAARILSASFQPCDSRERAHAPA